ncbi:MAG: hypothetical protein KDG52_11235 [Rhodocyclaceae bacterium]|nr:hypothetical protein [Rhodocyclaceae bacterium]
MIAIDLARALARRFAGAADGPSCLAAFRAEYPLLRFYGCSEDDIPPRLSPWVAVEGVAVYLVDASAHCLSLTGDPESACGLVFAIEAGD